MTIRVALPIVVFGWAFVAFLPALSGEFLNWDDVAFIVDNPKWQGLSGEHLGWMFTSFEAGHYQPLSWMSLALDHAFWGLDPRGYHLTNQLLHAGNAVLLYLVILALLPRRAPFDRVAAGVGALVFAVHPLRVESVAWITERRDVLSAGLLLGSLLAYLRAVHTTRRAPWWHVLGVGLLATSLLAKAWGMTFAFVLLVIDRWVLHRRLTRRLLVEKLPYLAVGMVAAVVAFFAQRAAGAAAEVADHSWLERALQAGYGTCFYVIKTIVPTSLSPFYLMEEQRDLRDIPLYAGALVGAVAATMVVLSLRRRLPWLLAAWGIYLIVVSPVLGVMQSGAQLVADRYSYLSCMPFAVLAAAGVAMGMRTHVAGRTAVGLVAGAVGTLMVLTVLAIRQSTHWQSTFSLWDHAVRVQPANYVARVFRANARLAMLDGLGTRPRLDDEARRQVVAAIEDYDQSIALAPGYGWAYASRALAHAAMEDHEAVVRDVDMALELIGPDPTLLQLRGRAQQALGPSRQ